MNYVASKTLAHQATQMLQWNDENIQKNLHDEARCILDEKIRNRVHDLSINNKKFGSFLKTAGQWQESISVFDPVLASDLKGELKLCDDDIMRRIVLLMLGKLQDHGVEVFDLQGVYGIQDPLPELVVDYGGDTNIPKMDRGGNDLGLYNRSEFDGLREKLMASWSLLSECNPVGFDLVARFVSLLVFRTEAAQHNAFSSGTFKSLPGMVLICNAHLPRISEVELAEALLHEAIHCCLFWYEFEERQILVDQNSFAISPWSQSKLGAHSAIHAIAVWLGLLNHYLKLTDKISDRYKAKFVEQRLDFIRKGFKSESMGNYVGLLKNVASDHGRLIIQAMEIEMVGRDLSLTPLTAD